MVGVPRSRGCAGCREQKKRCVVDSKPPCSRCLRLDITCSGYGELRIKFQDESHNFVPRGNRKKASTSPSSSLSSKSPEVKRDSPDKNSVESAVMVLPRRSKNSPRRTNSPKMTQDVAWTVLTSMPTNQLTSLIAKYTQAIDGRDKDTGHHLVWNMGDFLADILPYLGSNVSLDAAADALVAGYDHFRRHNGKAATVSPACIQKYSEAVTRLRTSLSTFENACDPATLCAIEMVMTVESLMGISNKSPLQHAGGAARILKCRGTRPPKDGIEKKILKTLRGPVVIQAFFLDESFYTATEWNNIIKGFSSDMVDKGFFPGLAAVARLFQITRRLLSRGPAYPSEKEELIASSSILLQSVSDQASDWLKRLNQARDKWTLDGATRTNKFDHGYCTREYGFALCTQIEVNCIISALRGEYPESAKVENARICEEMCKLGEHDAIFHRPLGSGWILIAMSTGYIGARSIEERIRVMKIMAEYSYDFPTESQEMQMIQMDEMAKYLSCSDLVPGLGS